MAWQVCNGRQIIVIDQISFVSHHSGSLLGAIELTILCAFTCKEEYFDGQIRETVLYK